MKKIKITLLLSGWVISACATTLQLYKQDSYSDTPKDNRVSAALYSQSFANKYHLKPDYVESLPPNVEAMEMVVTKHRVMQKKDIYHYFKLTPNEDEIVKGVQDNILAFEILHRGHMRLPVYYYHDCYWNLYLRNTVPINYPEESLLGDIDMVKEVNEQAFAPIKQALGLKRNQSHPLLQDNTTKHYLNKAFLYNETTKKLTALPWRSFYKEIVPGINLIMLGPDKACKGFKANFPDVTLLVQQNKRVEYKGVNSVEAQDLSDFLKVKVPNSLLNQDGFKIAR